jgi:RNA polymerase sigma factor (sigma-70 family)
MAQRNAHDLDPKVAGLIRRKARLLSRSYGFRKGDEEDLRQEMAVHVIERMGRHDPRRSGRPTFVDRVLEAKAADLLRHVLARKRDRRREGPLDSDVPERGQEERRERAWSLERLVLRLDVRDALAGLPDDLRNVAGLLTVYGQAEAARRTGLTRQQVRGTERRIERHLRERGLP